MVGWHSYLRQHESRNIEELIELARIPSISALPEHAGDVATAAQWVSQRMESAGLENVQILPTDGHPVVYSDWLHAGPDQPTALIYAHFDVQPVDPLHLWHSPPFEPARREGRIYARGASDDKGNLIAAIQALEAMLATEGELPINIKCLFEGEEEIGSRNLPAFVEQNRERLGCDYAISADSLQWSPQEGNLIIGLKGLAALQINVRGANQDLHSGLYGGTVSNPLHALAQIIASTRGPDGKILVEGFYDDVRPLSDTDRALISRAPYDEAEYMGELGLEGLFGEPDYTTRERAWARPTLEVNGMWGGFQGEGSKTVIPNEAHAKITCRLVADQHPQRIVEAIVRHAQEHAPPGVVVTADTFGDRVTPYLMDTDHPGNEAVRVVLAELYGREPYYTRLGGTIGFVSMMKDMMGVDTLMFGFTLGDEQLHAPNEFYRLDSFDKCQQGYCMLLHELRH